MKMCNRMRAPVAGFALLETLIAFVVLAIGLLALLSFHNESQRNTGEAKARSEAVAIGEQKLQELQSFLSDGDPRIADGTTGTDVYTGINAVFTRNWEVVTTTSADVNLAQITVQWGDVGTGVELKSEIYKWEPSSSTQNFLEVVKNNSGSPGSGGDWFGTGTGTGTGTGGDGSGDDSGDDGTGNDGDTGEEGTTYTVEFTGSVNASGTVGGGPNQEDVQLTGISFSGNDQAVSCTTNFPITSGSYSCVSSGIPTGTAWSGTITFQSNGTVCSPNGGSVFYSGTATQEVNNVVLRKNNGQCP